MSQIPKKGGSGKPLIKTTSTVTTKTPAGGSKTTTTTKIRELEPCTYGDKGKGQTSGCQPCPSRSQKSIRQPQAAAGARPPRQPAAAAAAPRAQPPRMAPPRAQPPPPRRAPQPRAPAPRPRPPPVQLKPPVPGQYSLPAQYGPMSRAGKDVVYSSPGDLRGRMEAKVPKELKYEGIKICPGARAKDRSDLPGTTMADMFSGSFNVYGKQPVVSEEMVGRNVLDERINQQTAEELFNMSSPEVSMVESQVIHDMFDNPMFEEGGVRYSKSHHVEQVEQQMIQTPVGMEPLIQQTYTEKRVERDDVAERLVKNLVVTEIDEKTGRGTRVTISEQQLNPDYGLSVEGKDIATLKETVSITPSYTSSVKDVIHETIKPKVDIDPAELAKLVEEESQDVENTLKMVPPDMVLQDDRYAAKRRLQKLRLNTESMILLEECVVNPTPTADEAMTETPPEALANIMHTVESGVTPECAPDQVFHTLFEEKTTEHSVILSSVGPGPLQDVIVPQTLTKDIHKESMTPDLTDLTNIYKNVTDAKDWPPVDIFASVMDEQSKSPKKGIKSRPFKTIDTEEVPWRDEDLAPMVNIVGAEPVIVLEPSDVPELEESGKLEEELTHGIEYFVDADPVQYMSRVTLRGSNPPPWFPGYIYALPEFPDVVKLARSPDEVLISSWKSCQPKIIPEASISILH